MVFEVRLQKDPQKTLTRLKKKYRPRYQAISKTLLNLQVDPISYSIALQDPYLFGFRRAKAGEDRIIFQICKECRADENIRKERMCFDCESIPENGLMVFDIDARKKIYKNRMRKRR